MESVRSWVTERDQWEILYLMVALVYVSVSCKFSFWKIIFQDICIEEKKKSNKRLKTVEVISRNDFCNNFASHYVTFQKIFLMQLFSTRDIEIS